MRRVLPALLLLLTGTGLLRATLLSDDYLRYVKEGLRLPLVASGILLTLLGLASAAAGAKDHGHPRHEDHGAPHHGAPHEDHGHGHDHSAGPRVAWLLLLPALSLLLYAPPALGAYTAARSNPGAVEHRQRFAPLPAGSPLPMTLTDFTTRVQQDPAHTVRGRGVRLTGFVTPAGHGGGWYLTRIIFTCCAADAQTVRIRVYGTPAPPANTWLAVTGTWHPRGVLGTRSAEAALDAGTTTPVAQPVNAFTDDLPLTPS
ncbi:TIGR03943 family protein [Streptomyces sp. NPDC047000]|uniref:TIGR03943 family putative permease subunit n=1 Tax=Streptomyces sp. NPDC047000 TaxID=3155474 RepID=UPI0033CB98E0